MKYCSKGYESYIPSDEMEQRIKKEKPLLKLKESEKQLKFAARHGMKLLAIYIIMSLMSFILLAEAIFQMRRPQSAILPLLLLITWVLLSINYYAYVKKAKARMLKASNASPP